MVSVVLTTALDELEILLDGASLEITEYVVLIIEVFKVALKGILLVGLCTDTLEAL